MLKNNKQIILVLVVGVILVAVLAIFLLRPKPEVQNTQAQLKTGWTYSDSKLCGVSVPLPPHEPAYMTDRGEYWSFQENTQTQGNPFFPNVVVTILQNPELGGSGYVAGSVIVLCKPNIDKDSPDTLATKYNQYFEAINKNVPVEAQITVKPVKHTTLWGYDVLVASFEGGMFSPEDEFYFVTTDAFSYLISKPQHSEDAAVKQTTQEVFEKVYFR